MLPLAITWGRIRSFALLGRLTVGGALLKALLERVDNYPRCVQYTPRVNAFLPQQRIPTVAALATVPRPVGRCACWRSSCFRKEVLV
jgi:hypothetical protein